MDTPHLSPLTPHQALEPLAYIARERTYPPRAVTEACFRAAPMVGALSPVDRYQLLTPALCSKVPHLVLQWLANTGILEHVLPELAATIGFLQEGDRRHKDVWEHTKQVVWQAVPRPAVRWAAVLHDIGKVKTRRFLPGDKVTFHGHAEVGMRMFQRGTVKRIAFPPEIEHAVGELILFHLRPGQYDESWTDAAVRRFARETQHVLTDLLDLSRADITTRRPGKRKAQLFVIAELNQRIKALQAEDEVPKPLPPGLGKNLMDALALPPGKHIGQLREQLEALVQARELEGGREPAYYVDEAKRRGLVEGLTIVPPRGFGS